MHVYIYVYTLYSTCTYAYMCTFYVYILIVVHLWSCRLVLGSKKIMTKSRPDPDRREDPRSISTMVLKLLQYGSLCYGSDYTAGGNSTSGVSKNQRP